MGVRATKFGENTVVSIAPRSRKLYLHNAPTKKVIPTHLKEYTKKFSAAATKCASDIGSDVRGNARVMALNACISKELKR